jgi:hypothetical protein
VMHSGKIFVGTEEIAGYYTNLVSGFQEIGVSVTFATRDLHQFEYSDSTLSVPLFIRGYRYLRRKQNSRHLNYIVKFALAFGAEFLWHFWALKIIFTHDKFIFGFGRSLFKRNLDLPILKILKKKVIMNLAHGSEARPPYFDGFQQIENSNTIDPYTLLNLSKRAARLVKISEKYATVVIGAPYSTSPFAILPFVNTSYIGVPAKSMFPIANSEEKFVESMECVPIYSVRILHAPSSRIAKGSDSILEVIGELKSEGLAVEYHELSNVSNFEVQNAITCCDFVIDQLYSDGPLAGFATEAACQGKVALVSGYGLKELKELVPEEVFPVSILTTPNQFKDTLREIILNPTSISEMGIQARKFLQDNWSAPIVAERYLLLFESRIPNNWWLDPNEVAYLHGCGQSTDMTKTKIRILVSQFGASALQLNHKPHYLKKVLDFSLQS